MLKSLAIIAAIVFALVVLCQAPLWPVELGFGLAGAGFSVMAALVGALVSVVVGVFAALLAVPAALGATALGLIVAFFAVVGALLAVFVPLALPVLVLVGLVWIVVKASQAANPPASGLPTG